MLLAVSVYCHLKGAVNINIDLTGRKTRLNDEVNSGSSKYELQGIAVCLGDVHITGIRVNARKLVNPRARILDSAIVVVHDNLIWLTELAGRHRNWYARWDRLSKIW